MMSGQALAMFALTISFNRDQYWTLHHTGNVELELTRKQCQPTGY